MSTVQTVPTARDAVHTFIDGWNAHSPRAVREAFTADGRVTDPVVAAWISGEAIEVAVQRALDHYADVAFTVRSILESGDRVAFEWQMTMTLATPDGRRVPLQLEGCDVCRVREGKLTELRGYFDRAGIAEQLKAAGVA
jgi:ketosteroid isomerase-like protein